MELPGPKTKTFFITPGNANSFFNWPLEFPQYNFSIHPQEVSGLQPCPPVWNFFWSSSNCHASIIVIWLFGWNSPVHYWSIPERLQTGKGVRGVGVGGGRYISLKPSSGNFRFVTLPFEILEKTSFWNWKFHGQKPRPKEISHQFFFETHRNSTSFLIGPWDFYMPFLQYPWIGNSMYWTLGPCLDFFWNSPLLEMSSVKLQQKMQCYLIKLIKWTVISSLEFEG